ncbi:MAG: hypothetical protein WBD67_13125 [Terracidiphilus sp.]
MSPALDSPSTLALSGYACPACGSGKLRRLARTSFLERRVLSLLGYYPWECPICRRKQMYRQRGRRQRRAGQIE